MEYDKVQVDGHTLADRLRQIVELAEILTATTLAVTQGSYSDNVAQSGGTHARGGAVDLSVHGHTQAEVEEVVQSLRQLGCAAWHRLPSQGDWPEHIHAIDSGATDMSPQALWQVNEYKAGRNGLTNQQAESDHIPLVPYVYAPGDIVEIQLSDQQLEALGKSIGQQVWNQAIAPTQFVKDVYQELGMSAPKPREAGDLLYNQAARLQRIEAQK